MVTVCLSFRSVLESEMCIFPSLSFFLFCGTMQLEQLVHTVVQRFRTVLIAIADYFNVSLAYLVGRSDKPEVNK